MQRGQLDQQREQQDLDERRRDSWRAWLHRSLSRVRVRASIGLNSGARGQLERDAGEMAAELGERDLPAAHGGIEDRGVARVGAFQHDEMIEVPVQDRGLLQLVELVDLEPHRARRQLEIGGDPHQMLERRALDRGRVALAQPGQVDPMAVMAGDHRQRGEAAFGGLRLQQRLHAPRPGPFDRAHRPIARSIGSNSTSHRLPPLEHEIGRKRHARPQRRAGPPACAAPSRRSGRGCGTPAPRCRAGRDPACRLGRDARNGGDGAAAGAVFLVGEGVEQQPHLLAGTGEADRARRSRRARLRDCCRCGTMVTSERSGRARWPTSTLTSPTSPAIGRGEHEPVGAHQLRALLGQRGALGEQHRAAAARSPARAAASLRLGRWSSGSRWAMIRSVRDSTSARRASKCERLSSTCRWLPAPCAASPAARRVAASASATWPAAMRRWRSSEAMRGGEAGALLLEACGPRSSPELPARSSWRASSASWLASWASWLATPLDALGERQGDERRAGRRPARRCGRGSARISAGADG